MKEPYEKGVATHLGPESCAVARKGGGEALTGVRAGQVLSREILTLVAADGRHENSRAPTPSGWPEGNIGGAAIARHPTSPARSETLSTYGNTSHGNREIPRPPSDGNEGRAVNPKGARRR